MTPDEKKPTPKHSLPQRILSWIAIVILVGLYVLALIFALQNTDTGYGLMMACLFLSMAIAVIGWFMIMVYRYLKKRNANNQLKDEIRQKEEDKTSDEITG